MVVEVMIEASRIVVASVLFVAGISKIIRLQRFRLGLNASRLFSRPGAALVMVGVPVGELLLPVWCVLSPGSVLPAAAMAGMLVVFTGYVVLLRTLKRDAGCGCFGGAGRIGDPMMARNAGLVLLAIATLSGRYGAIVCVAGMALLLLYIVSLNWQTMRAMAQGDVTR